MRSLVYASALGSAFLLLNTTLVLGSVTRLPGVQETAMTRLAQILQTPFGRSLLRECEFGRSLAIELQARSWNELEVLSRLSAREAELSNFIAQAEERISTLRALWKN